VVENGRLVAVEADPTHPTGQALCGKGKAAPEYVYSNARILYPMKRTRPKGDSDAGWQRISWEEALETTAERLQTIQRRSGTESIAFSIATSAGTAMQDGYAFVERLRQAFGTPNAIASIELCNFAKSFVYPHTFGVGMPVAEVEKSDCIVLWGHNPTMTWLPLGTRIVKAKRRGAKLIFINPARVGLAGKANEWLRLRPGTDGALALSLAHTIIKEELYDDVFLREWTNGPFLVRDDDGTFVSAADLSVGGDPSQRAVWNSRTNDAVLYDPGAGRYVHDGVVPTLRGQRHLDGVEGAISCRTAFDRYADLCAMYAPDRAAEITWLPGEQIRETARLIGASKAVSFSTWAGLEMHSNTSQTARAIACLYALTGCFDAPGGNVILTRAPTNDVLGRELMPAEMLDRSLGMEERKLGPEAIFGWINSDALYKAVLDRKPYGVDALVSFGLNLLVSHADGERGARALDALEFMVHADLFMTPTASHADIFLPVNTPWEREALKTDFAVDQRASARVQLRARVIESRGESRSDAWIAFELAKRLGLAEHFWGGDIDGGYREILESSGISLEDLRDSPAGLDLAFETQYRKYRGDGDASTSGFSTPSRKVEIYSETFLQHGYAPLPEFVEPAMGPLSRPDLARDFPLVLTDTKSTHYLHSQFRHVARLRRSERDPRIDLHPQTAAARGIADGDWVELRTPHGGARMRARLVGSTDPRVVVATVGWWQACEELALEGLDAESDSGANLNRVIGNQDYDPIGGCVPHKSYLCEVRKATRCQ
jgi:anaerobic selenocysteine-containing dehydrogenase